MKEDCDKLISSHKGSGIGLATGTELHAAGWTICIIDYNSDNGKLAAKQLRGSFYEADVSSYESLAFAFESAFRDYKRFDFGISPSPFPFSSLHRIPFQLIPSAPPS